MLDYSVSGPIADILIPDVSCLSRHDIDAARNLRDAIWEANDDNSVKVIVLRSPGDHFCPREFFLESKNATADLVAYEDAFYGPHGLYQAVSYPKKVVIVEVQGECAGAGTTLSLCADLVVATTDATFRSPTDDLPASNLVLGILTLGLHQAKAWTLTGTTLSANEALSMGLVNYLTERDNLHAETTRWAARVSKMPLDALTLTKVGFNAVADAGGASEDFAMSGFYLSSHAGLLLG